MLENVAILFIYMTIFGLLAALGAAVSDFLMYRQERRRKNRWWRGN